MEELIGFHKYLAQDMWAEQEEGGRETGCPLGCALGRIQEPGLAGQGLLRLGI